MVRKKTPARGGRRAGRSGRLKPKIHAASGPAVQFDVPALDALDLASSMDRVAKILARSVGEVARKYDATAGQMFIVAALCRAPDGLTAKHLASALAIRPGSLTGMLDTLEKRGVVRRDRVPGDARQQRLVLLDGARELVDALTEVDAAVGATLVGLDGERRAGLRTLSEETEEALRAEMALPMPKVLRSTEAEPQPESEVDASPEADKTVDEEAEVVQPAAAVVEMPEVPVAPAVAEPAAARPYTPLPDPGQPGSRLPPSGRTDDAGIRRNLFSLTTRVLNAVDAQVRKRRDN